MTAQIFRVRSKSLISSLNWCYQGKHSLCQPGQELPQTPLSVFVDLSSTGFGKQRAKAEHPCYNVSRKATGQPQAFAHHIPGAGQHWQQTQSPSHSIDCLLCVWRPLQNKQQHQDSQLQVRPSRQGYKLVAVKQEH